VKEKFRGPEKIIGNEKITVSEVLALLMERVVGIFSDTCDRQDGVNILELLDNNNEGMGLSLLEKLQYAKRWILSDRKTKLDNGHQLPLRDHTTVCRVTSTAVFVESLTPQLSTRIPDPHWIQLCHHTTGHGSDQLSWELCPSS